jgi:hypothetical protein
VIPERTHKRCARCQERLPIGDFRPNAKLRDGLHSWCRPCCDEYRRQWRSAHPEAIARYNAARRLGERERECVDCGESFAFRSAVAVRCPGCRRRRKLGRGGDCEQPRAVRSL